MGRLLPLPALALLLAAGCRTEFEGNAAPPPPAPAAVLAPTGGT